MIATHLVLFSFLNGATGGVHVPIIAVTLTDANNAALPNLTGLRWAWWDQPTLNAQVAPVIQGTGASTDSTGKLSVTTLTGSALIAGGVGWIEVTNSDGTVSQSPVGKVAAGPIQVS